MRKLVLVFGILASVVSVSMGAMSEEEFERIKGSCYLGGDKSACEALISSLGFISAEQCDKNGCTILGTLYYYAGRYREAIPYLKKVIALGGGMIDYFMDIINF